VAGKTVWIFVGGQLEDNEHLLARFSLGLYSAIPALLALSALLGFFVSRRALRPVDKLTTALRSISIGNLSERLPVAPTGDELQRLAETSNEMLSRLEGAVTRINRFTADASHELRSPVSLIRTVSEYALRNPQLPAEAREAFEDVLAESIQAAELLDDMLTLARADAGHVETAFEPLDLREVLQEAGENIRPLAEAKRQTLVVRSGAVSVPLVGHRSSLRRLLWTLLDNAVKYTPAGGDIEAALQTGISGPSIRVADTGIGIPEALLPRVFERFFRADPSRSQVEGAGLGLAIAKWIADMHHATLRVQSRENRGTEFTVVFPTR
jgi:signal transduction histidine kinase